MTNPFQTIDKRLEVIESLLIDLKISQKPSNPVKVENEKLTRKEVCSRFKISLGTVHSLMRSGDLPFAKIGRKTIFEAEEVQAFFEANKKRLNHE
ncbi:MAG: helix-turn-helix domain-containing protein [Cyclobacteriaceae bacterium]